MQSNPTPHCWCPHKEENTDKVAAASRNDATQILGVLLESVSLERIDLVADDAGEQSWLSSQGPVWPVHGRQGPAPHTPPQCPQWLRGGLSAWLRVLLNAHSAICQLPSMNTSSTIKVWMSRTTLTRRSPELRRPSVSRHEPACSTVWWMAVHERARSLRWSPA